MPKEKQTPGQNSTSFCHIRFAKWVVKTHYFPVQHQEPDDEFIPTRATLIQRLKNWQDQASWQDFFETYWKLIYGLARKLGLSEDDAQDVVQETLISVAQAMPSFKYDPKLGSFKSWLRQVIRWRIADHLRKRVPGAVSIQAETETEDSSVLKELPDNTGVSMEQFYEQEWQKNLLDAAIANVKRKLDPKRYQVFDFYVNRGWPPEKVANSFNISVDQVYLAKHRITEMIKTEAKRLEDEML
jgi:RNA polymerase sigma-70 factor (ECF subfamily)